MLRLKNFVLTSGSSGIFPGPRSMALSTSYWLLDPLRMENQRARRPGGWPASGGWSGAPCAACRTDGPWGRNLSHSVRALCKVCRRCPLLLKIQIHRSLASADSKDKMRASFTIEKLVLVGEICYWKFLPPAKLSPSQWNFGRWTVCDD